MSAGPPILVIGSYLSGLTGVGERLAGAPEVAYIHEPFSVLHRPGVYDATFGTGSRISAPRATPRTLSSSETCWPCATSPSPRSHRCEPLATPAAGFEIAFGSPVRDVGGGRPLVKDQIAVF